MEPTVNTQNNDQPVTSATSAEKSELMLYFENQVNDTYWAYKDLLKEIFAEDKDPGLA